MASSEIRDERTLELIARGQHKDAVTRMVIREGYTYAEAKELVALQVMGETQDSLTPLALLSRIRDLERKFYELEK